MFCEKVLNSGQLYAQSMKEYLINDLFIDIKVDESLMLYEWFNDLQNTSALNYFS